MRLDQLLVKLSLAPSRAKAQELIRQGEVEVFERGVWDTVTSVSHPIREGGVVPPARLKSRESLRFVSRGGLKLMAALEQLEMKPEALTVLDLGQSTGGFTDCLLQSGAEQVVGVDVGHGQLAEKLKVDPRVKSFEGLHIKDISQHKEFLKHCPPSGFALAVMDLAFISLPKALPWVTPLIRSPGGHLLALVKPQFEVGADHLNKKGVVKDDRLYSLVEVNIKESLKDQGFQVKAYFESSVLGQEGNQEFFVYAEKCGDGQFG